VQRINANYRSRWITHQWEEVANKDLLRSSALENIGFTIIRFHDDEVLNDMSNVNRKICFYIEEYLNEQTTPLIPPQAGDTECTPLII